MFAANLRSLLVCDLAKSTINSGSYRVLISYTFCKKELGFPSRFSTYWTNSIKNKTKHKFLLGNERETPSRQNVTLPKKTSKFTFKNPLNWKSFLICTLFAGGFIGFVTYIKNKKLKARNREKTRFIGKAKIGGSFNLVDQNNKPVSSEDLLGKWLLIYFGFTHCPDVCPDEIEKMIKVVDALDNELKEPILKPVFISVDPERDTPAIVGQYVKEFSDKILGLTGTKEQVDKVCKAYRVYYSAGPRDDDNDYIVDHTIITYFVGPDGNFIDYFTQTKSVEQIVNDIKFYMGKLDLFKPQGFSEKLKSLF